MLKSNVLKAVVLGSDIGRAFEAQRHESRGAWEASRLSIACARLEAKDLAAYVWRHLRKHNREPQLDRLSVRLRVLTPSGKRAVRVQVAAKTRV